MVYFLFSRVKQGAFMTVETDVLILGAGAAGLFCAATAGQRGRKVVVLDHAPVHKLAEKIRISGGGKCNFTNRQVSAANYVSNNPHFCRSALSLYTPQDFIDLVEKHGIAYEERAHGQLFCLNSAQNIIEMLLQECREAGVTLAANCQILSVQKNDSGFEVDTNLGRYQAASLVVATGGLAIPQIGATGLGYQLAEQFGLALVTPAPALVPLTFHVAEAERFTPLSGTSMTVALSSEDGRHSFTEQLLITHKGLSGPVCLQLSNYWHAGQMIRVNLAPKTGLEAYFSPTEKREFTVLRLLMELGLTRRFAEAWVFDVFGDTLQCSAKWKQLLPKQQQKLQASLQNWALKPNGTQGYKKAEVTRGGVDTAELSSKTMMSKSVAGLFFIGEVVDVTGWLGGYNFQWAWSSAYAAGQYA